MFIVKVMGIEIFKPEINAGDKYAVAVPCGSGDGKITGVSILKTYPTPEALETGYDVWKYYAKAGGLSSPVKIKILDKEMHCKILP